jgi:peptide/nickel transport system substrate-binding protein
MSAKEKRVLTRRDFIKLTGGVAGSLLMASCAPKPTPEVVEKVTEKVFTPTPTLAPRTSAVYAVSYETDTADPHKCAGSACQRITEHMYEGLTAFDRVGNVEPCLAESWENSDERTWIFHLRKGVKFHNGEELDAEDVKFSLERLIDPDTAAPYASWFKAIETVDVVDKYTVKLNLNIPYTPILGALAADAAGIVNKTWAEALLDKGTLEFTLEAVGTGPYKLEEFIPADHFTYVKYEDYWKEGLPHIDEVIWKVTVDMDARVAGLRGGTIDFAELDDVSYELLKNDGNVNVYALEGFKNRCAFINCTREPFTDVRVRQAISKALDRQEVIDKVAGGYGQLTGTISTGWGNYYIPLDELPYEVDVEGAKALLADAGFPDGLDTTILSLSPPPFPDIATMMQAQLAKAGINAELLVLETGTWLDMIHEFDYDIHLNGYRFNYDPDAILGRNFICGSEANFGQWCNEEYDRLRLEAVAISDVSKREEIYDRMQKMILEEVPILSLFVASDFYGTSKRLKGFEPAKTQRYKSVFAEAYTEA